MPGSPLTRTSPPCPARVRSTAARRFAAGRSRPKRAGSAIATVSHSSLPLSTRARVYIWHPARSDLAPERRNLDKSTEGSMTTTIDGKPTAAEAPQAPEFDPQALEAFMEHAGMHATAALNAALVSLGDRLGLWQALSEAGPTTAGELAARTGLARRYLEEWLAAQAANGFVGYDAATNSFRLTPEATMVMADENSPALMIGAFQGVIAVGRLLPTLEQVFRSGDGIAWQDHDPEFFDVQERFSRPIQRQFLVNAWLAGVSGLIETLTRGARVADVGVGYGTSTILLAQAFPHSRFTGFDFHDVSIARARKAAQEAGVADRVQFEVADARS